MRLTIRGGGEDVDDKTVMYTLCAENDTFKGTAEFYGYADGFKEFADQLLQFPFESKAPVRLEADNMTLEVSLMDPVGRIRLKTDITDWERNHVVFSDYTAETETLHKLARQLKSTNFAAKAEVRWEF